jgi:hypothetical protein
MTVRNFWTIFLKILGIWLIVGSFVVIPQFFTSIFLSRTFVIEDFIFVLAPMVAVICFYLLILRVFIFKTDWLINKLKLERGFSEEKLELNLQLSTILNVATIVIGGLMFVDSLPTLCKEIFVFFQRKVLFSENQSSGWIIADLIKSVLGYLLMTNSKSVVSFIEKRTFTDQSDKF